MASLFIKDSETAELVARIAKRSGLTKTALVREMAVEREAQLDRGAKLVSSRERLKRFRRERPLPPPTGLTADKAFYDDLSGGY